MFWRRAAATGGAPRWQQSAPLALALPAPLERADVAAAQAGTLRVLATPAGAPEQALVLTVSNDPTCLTSAGAQQNQIEKLLACCWRIAATRPAPQGPVRYKLCNGVGCKAGHMCRAVVLSQGMVLMVCTELTCNMNADWLQPKVPG